MKLSAILPFIGAAVALPQGPAVPPSLGAFGVMAARSASPIHLTPMVANGTSFWLGGKTSSYCPPNVPEMGGVCPPGNETQIIGGSALDVQVPGGQQIYIAPGGALKFTVPHSAAMPPGSIKSGFEYKPGKPLGHWTWKGESGSGFMACPVDDRWQVFAGVKDAEVPSGNAGDCLGFSAMAVAAKNGSSPAAWEYI